MKEMLHSLTSELQNADTRNIDQLSITDILKMINQEDSKIAYAVEQCIPDIAKAVEAIVHSFRSGGRLLYFGAGTSGRLGILDASECPPTYGTPAEMVVGVIAGGVQAIHKAVEGAEDDPLLGASDVDLLQVSSVDTVVGISASGRTPYVIGAMRRAGALGATVIGIANNSPAAMREEAAIMIEAVVGPEVILGSTRMKAGTAQKLILNMLTTAAMIRSGKVYDNLMVDMQSTNEKLIVRAQRLIILATGCDPETAAHAYKKANYHVKKAIVMILTETSAQEADELLARSGGFVREAARAGGSIA